jgi:hypothetical protein
MHEHIFSYFLYVKKIGLDSVHVHDHICNICVCTKDINVNLGPCMYTCSIIFFNASGLYNTCIKGIISGPIATCPKVTHLSRVCYIWACSHYGFKEPFVCECAYIYIYINIYHGSYSPHMYTDTDTHNNTTFLISTSISMDTCAALTSCHSFIVIIFSLVF